MNPDVSARRTGALVAGGCAVGFALLAAYLVPWDWLPGGDLVEVSASEVFTAAEIAGGDDFSGLKWTLSWWDLGLSLILAMVLGLTPLGARLVRRLPGRWWGQALSATLLVLLLGRLVTLPFSWQSQRVDLEHGMSGQPWTDWWQDQGLGLLVAWVSTSVVVVVLLGLVRAAPRRWPALAAGAAAGLVFAGSFAWPLLVEPLFNDFDPLPDGPLRTEIMQLADSEGVRIDDVLVADASRRTTTLNAYVSGFGSSRRVVVYDTLLEGLPQEQAMVVVAHELGHAKHRDVLVGTALASLGAGVGMGLLGVLLSSRRLRGRAGVDAPGSAAVIPLVLLLSTVGTLLAAPVQSTLSRAVEARADRVALAATGETDAFEEMQRQLALRSRADVTPPAWRHVWFGSHPTTLQRIGLARGLEQRP